MISDEEQRVFVQVNGGAGIVDITASINDFRSTPANFTLEDTGYLYIGQVLPFAHKYLDISTANTVAATANVEIWNGNTWEQVVDIRDGTSQGGVPLASSGYLKFRPDWDESGWVAEDTDEITGLTTGPKIKKMFWARISISVTATAVDLNYIGQKFSNDDELFSHYPGLNNQDLRDAYEQGSPDGTKTDWDEQSLMASEAVVRDMKTKNIIFAEGQLVDTDLLKLPGIHKQAQIIFGGLDRRGSEDESKALKRYHESMSLKRLNVDQDGDGELGDRDRVLETGFANR